ncbi:MAG: hypothetical protein KF691_00995 [Phycisphaeraceae bacterium]|nr:hypothetical protein [Phycisphaeraceae bacterium]
MSLPRLIVLFTLLLAHAALAGPRKPKVMFVHSDTAAAAQDVVNNLSGTGLFAQVDSFDAGASTPTFAQLSDYDAVLLCNNVPWADRVALGNVLAQFVDYGHGLVQTMFTTGGAANSNLAGAWTSSYNCIAFGTSQLGSPASLGTIAQPDHLIMNGVASFSGGASSPRPSGTTLIAGATLIASWSDGKPLVVAGPKINRVDLGFYPARAGASSSGWDSTTDGTKLLANALMSVIRPKVLLCVATNASFSDPEFTDTTARMWVTGMFQSIAQFNAANGTPSLNLLKDYDAVLTWCTSQYQNSTAMGNVLADYVDAGYGVVVAGVTNALTGAKTLAGRWNDGEYRLLTGGPSSTTGAASLGTIFYNTHPIMNGVSSFSGGSWSFRTTSTTLPAHGFTVATWNDGKILVAASTLYPNRADLGFYPPSSAAGAGFWDPATKGDLLLANALMYTIRPFVCLLHSESNPADASTLAQRLLQLHRFSGVRVLTGLDSVTPLATSLRPFSSILLWGHTVFTDAATVGNRLADYVDAGGSVVEGLFSNSASLGLDNARPRGRWISQGYDITPEGSTGPTLIGSASLGSAVGPQHPITTFVRQFAGGINSFRQNNNPILRGRRLLNWSDGKMLASLHGFRRRVDLGFWPVSGSEASGSWNVRTDGNTLIANSLDFASSMKPCPGDFNGDGQVDDSDFLLFVIYYNNLLDPRGDLTGDGFAEDADFSVFVNSYDALVCP